jgi:DNA repair exonuclease SbcCD ATPase subunit
MKPISIRFKCFGPYLNEQFIDFTQLEKSGLFLICGETGSGKTTILDAISYALYGRSSGALRGDLSVMRCKLAQPKDETLVEFIFDSGGHRYRFTRSLKYGRKNLNDSHDCARLEDGVFVPIFENPKLKSVNEKAEELIGLTYDQFRQVIVLPQGQFETLLVSKSEEKEKIHVSLFHADRWQRIADELYNRVYAQDQSIKQQRQMIRAKLQEYGCVNLETLAILEEDTAQKLVQLRKELESAELHRDAVKKIHDEALIRSKDFADLKQTRQTLKQLLERSAHFDQEERLLQMADSAETATPQYTALKHVKNALDLAQKQKNTATIGRLRLKFSTLILRRILTNTDLSRL